MICMLISLKKDKKVKFRKLKIKTSKLINVVWGEIWRKIYSIVMKIGPMQKYVVV